MTVELGVFRNYSWTYWPCAVAGGFVPIGGIFMGRWLPAHIAFGVAAFIAWSFVGLVFGSRQHPRYGIPVWLAAILVGLAAGLASGVIAYYLPLK